MDQLFDYLHFLARTVTVAAAAVIVLGFAVARRRRHPAPHVEVVCLNERLRDLRNGLQEAMTPPAQFKKQLKEDGKRTRRERKAGSKKPVIFVVSFKGDIEASALRHLRNEITAILTSAKDGDEVLVRIESAGGLVHAYGLGASQLSRVKRKGIRLVAAIDKVAASGGYLMAAVADRILAAPFAVVGSIGVAAQVPNVHRLLKKHDVDFDVLTAGEHKRTLTIFGENTESGREKFMEELEDAHALFKEFVGDNRPDLDVAAVATGESWYGQRAIDRKLVDELCTSDEYLMAACDDKTVLEVSWVTPKKAMERLAERLGDSAAARLERWLPHWARRAGGTR